MRFPVVLFDFDGTVIDSGSIIIASMRHATKTVLGRDIPDEELGRAVGGSGLLEQMRVIAPDRVDELVACYREHNEPLHAGLAECVGMSDVLTTLKAALNHAFDEEKVASNNAWGRRVAPFEDVERARVRFLQVDEATEVGQIG